MVDLLGLIYTLIFIWVLSGSSLMSPNLCMFLVLFNITFLRHKKKLFTYKQYDLIMNFII